MTKGVRFRLLFLLILLIATGLSSSRTFGCDNRATLPLSTKLCIWNVDESITITGTGRGDLYAARD